MTKTDLTKNDEVKLLICTGFITAAVAVFTILPDGLAPTLLKTGFGLSAICAFAFFLLTAAKIKHVGTNKVDIYNFSENFRQKCYNLSIDTYGINLNLVLIYGIAGISGWEFQDGMLDWRIGIGMLASFLVTFALLRLDRERKK